MFPVDQLNQEYESWLGEGGSVFPRRVGQYFEIFRRIPLAVIHTISEVPPWLMKGRGRPFVGSRPVTTPKLIIA